MAWGSGFMNAKGAFDGWYPLVGPPQHAGRGSTELGVGRASRTADTASYWTQNFGAMGGKALKAPDGLPPIRAEVAPEKDPEDAAAAAAGDEGKAGDAPADPAPKRPADARAARGVRGAGRRRHAGARADVAWFVGLMSGTSADGVDAASCAWTRGPVAGRA